MSAIDQLAAKLAAVEVKPYWRKGRGGIEAVIGHEREMPDLGTLAWRTVTEPGGRRRQRIFGGRDGLAVVRDMPAAAFRGAVSQGVVLDTYDTARAWRMGDRPTSSKQFAAADYDDARKAAEAFVRERYGMGEVLGGTSVGEPEVTVVSPGADQRTLPGTFVTPVHRGPGPVMSAEEASNRAQDSALPGPWYHGGTGRSGEGARIWQGSRGMDLIGRGYYLTENPIVAGSYAGNRTAGGGVVREAYLDVDNIIEFNGPEFKEMRNSPEVRALMEKYPKLGLTGAIQIEAQRRGIQGWVFQAKVGRDAVIFDARRVLMVEGDYRDRKDR